MGKLVELAGVRFGRLQVLKRSEGKAARDSFKNARWDCLCICGNTKAVAGTSLRSGETKSCGCLRKQLLSDAARTHGMSTSPEWRTWQRMNQRCHNPKDNAYRDYGGRGLTVCDRWREGFMNFFADMGKRPDGRHTIERLDNSKGYSPENCKWATHYEQCRNRRNIRLIEYNGEKLCLSDWAARLGIKRASIYSKIRGGMTHEDAVAYYMRKKMVA